jgi:hypothetical protein
VNAVTPISWPAPDFAPETEAERRARQLADLREISALGMQLARAAAAQALAPEPSDPEQPAPPDPNLAFARVTNAVRQAIALETRIAAGTLARSADHPTDRSTQTPDPRRPKLRQTLHKLADAEPERAARAQLRRDIDDRIEDELQADPDAEIPIADILIAIGDDLGLRIDLSQLPYEYLVTPGAPRPTAPEPPD